MAGSLPIVQCLIQNGANIEAKDDEQRTPLHIASYYGATDVVRYLLSKGANKKAKCNGLFFHKTPYDIVCGYEESDKSQKDIIRELLKWRKTFHTKEPKNQTHTKKKQEEVYKAPFFWN